mgnify:CR=1 FL=1
MKKSVISFIAVMLVIVLLGLCAVMGFTVAGRTIIPAVNDTEHGIRLGLDLVGGSRIVYEAELPEGYDTGNLSSDMETAQSMIRQRLTNKGFTEATVALSGDNRISVEIPQITNPEEAVQTLGSTAQLVFMDADGKEWLTGTDIKRATAMYGQPTGAELTDEHYVQIEFTGEGTQKFSEATASIAARKNTDGMNFLAIVMDDPALSTPMVEHQLTQSTCVISGGNFTAESAKELADLINVGQMPFSLKQVELRSVGPQLGANALQTSLLAGAMTLAIMILPLIMRTAEEALMAVPDSFREGSFGLGAGRLRTVFRIVLPSAMPGILSGVILGIGRIVGETAALIFTAGTMAQIPGLLQSGRTLAIHMYVLSGEGLHMNEAYATAVVLLVVVLLMNSLSALVAKKLTKK